jgi:nicotinate dehydrogenase subunit B
MTSLPADLALHPSLDTWVRIDPEETVTFFTGKVELGQGLRTAIARIGAEELDVGLERVRVETADTAHGLDEGTTAGSMSIEQSGTALRQAAAEARAHLVGLAAAELGTDRGDLTVEDGRVIAGADGRATTYWQLLGGRRFDTEATGTAQPKRPEERSIVGKPGPRLDLPGIVTGTTRFIQDWTLPGMLHGRVVRPPSPGARLLDVDEAAVRLLGGVVEVVRDGSFIGVVATREEQAIAAAGTLGALARWTEEPTLPGSEKIAQWLQAQPGESFLLVDGIPVEGAVPPVQTAPGAARTIAATYTRPYTMHGSLGPSAAAALWEDGTLTVWSATQGAYALRDGIALVLGLDAGAVRVIHVPGAGCYGHQGADDVALDAALLARAVPGTPVRIVWTRAQEHAWEPYGPAMVVETQASLDDAGRLLDWNHDVWSNTHRGRQGMGDAGIQLAAAWHLASPFPKPAPQPWLAPQAGIHRNADPLYTVPNPRVVKHFVETTPVRVSALRSLGAFANVFAIESFMDELAEAAGGDPLEFRLSYLEDERARATLTAAAERIGWAERSGEFGRGTGIGFARYKNRQGYAAVAVELTVDDATAEIQIERAVVAADAGEIIDPDGLANQLEGGFVQAASWTLGEQVTFDDLRVASLDWESYPILRFPRIPQIETILLDHPDQPPLGAGEVAQGPTAAAIANAVHAAIGIRLRDLPFTPDRVRAAVAAA